MSDKRSTSLSPPEFFLLCQWGSQLNDAFGMPYLVGSCGRGERDYRDVDVRLMLEQPEFEALTGADPIRLVTLNMAISLWGQKVTGLPIDFQFQDRDLANAEYDGHTRNAIGIDPRMRYESSAVHHQLFSGMTPGDTKAAP